MNNRNQIVANTGLYYVCFKLSNRGWNVTIPGNTRRNICNCCSINGDRMFTIRVRSLSDRNPVSIGTNLNIVEDFWIVVNSLASGEPKAYILLPDEVKARAVRTEKDSEIMYYLDPKEYDVDEFKEEWDRIGTGL